MSVPVFCAWLVMVTEWVVALLPWALGALAIVAAGVGIWAAVEKYTTTGGTADG